MKKSAILVAVGALFAGSAYAQSSVTLYGIVDTTIHYTTNANANGNSLLQMDNGAVSNSRWGLKGSEDLGGGNKALFVLESGFDPQARSALGDRLCDYLPEDAQLELARFLAARGAQARLAGTVLKSFGAMAGVVGVQPIPLADFPVLLGLQMFMVSLIIHVSGREFSPRLAGEFAASLGLGFGAGLVFRETARAAVKILPVWGHMISGGVAGAGTYALGRAAIAYYIEGQRMARVRVPWRREKALPELEG